MIGALAKTHDRSQPSASRLVLRYVTIMASVSASPTAWLLRGYRRAGTQNNRLGESFPTVRSTCLYSYRVCSYANLVAEEGMCSACTEPCTRRACTGITGRWACRRRWPMQVSRRGRHVHSHVVHNCHNCIRDDCTGTRCAPLESPCRGGRFEYRHAHTRAIGVPSAMADVRQK